MGFELAEKSLLGTMLKENHLILDSGIREEMFRSHLHRNIFSAMRELVRKSRPVDYITIMTTRTPAQLGGANYLAELDKFTNSERFDEYKGIVIKHWKEQEKTRLLKQAQLENWNIADIQQAFDRLQEEDSVAADTSIKDELAAQYERPFFSMDDMTGTTTGLRDLDQLLNGFQDSEFIVIAGRPSMGKTDVLNHFALHAGWNGHLPIVFSLEMSRKSMIDRLIASAAGYSRLRMRNPFKHFTDKQKNSWTSTLDLVSKANIHIDDRSSLKVSQLKATARKLIKTNPSMRPIIFIDYLQIIRPEGQAGNPTQTIGQISGDLKNMAKEFNCPVVVLSQLSRAVEQRQDKRPIMSDLRDSGNIEQDADVVAFLYREDYYNSNSGSANVLEIAIAKHRNGPIGGTSVTYIKETGRLLDMNWEQREGGTG